MPNTLEENYKITLHQVVDSFVAKSGKNKSGAIATTIDLLTQIHHEEEAREAALADRGRTPLDPETLQPILPPQQ